MRHKILCLYYSFISMSMNVFINLAPPGILRQAMSHESLLGLTMWYVVFRRIIMRLYHYFTFLNFFAVNPSGFLLDALSCVSTICCGEYRSRTPAFAENRFGRAKDDLCVSISLIPFAVENIGVEPMTSCLQSRRSSQLS